MIKGSTSRDTRAKEPLITGDEDTVSRRRRASEWPSVAAC